MLPLVAFAALSAPAEKITFEQHVRPVLKAYCLDCHGADDKPKGKLDLRLKRFLVAGGRKGAAIVPGKADRSLLVERMASGEMPPGEKKVPPEQIALIRRWIDAGAPTLRDEPASLPPGIGISEQERSYWLYQPLVRPAVPASVETRPAHAGPLARNAIDVFLLAKMREKGLTFNPEADRLTLLRRASLVVTGLPPSPEEVKAFLADARPDAYERLVDRLLASPAYGERWARHWLDVSGHADSHGDGTADTPRPDAWRYRDWVVRALNADKPIDRLIIEQVAGDELLPRPWGDLTPEKADLLAATGFLRTAPDLTAGGGGPAEIEQNITDTLKVVGSALLGLSVGCAQCHDHRYDPIPQEDYYRLRAVFEPALNPAAWRRPGQRRVSLYTAADRAKAAAVDAEAAKMQADFNIKQAAHVKAAFDKELLKRPAEQRDALRAAFALPDAKRTPEQKKLVATNPSLNISPGILYQYNQPAADELKKMQDRINAKRAEKPAEGFVSMLDEPPGSVPVTRIFHRGDYRQPTKEVKPGDLTITAPEGKRLEIPAKGAGSTTGRRLAWAKHLTSGTHPLFGRVFVNRVWLHHMGRGIVETPDDLGILGQRPSHPELLDWLAAELPRSGWSLKHIHRLILTSTAFRQSSRRTSAQDAVDGGNALFARYTLRRLEAEAIRDRMLLASGRLDRRMGGPPVAVTEDSAGQVHAPDDKPRRGLYLQARRSKPVAFLGTFDAPSGDACGKRTSSTAAPQSLMLMNGDFVLQQAGHLARRLEREAATPAARVALAWELAYQRPPTKEEADLAGAFLARQSARLGAPAALTNLCQQLLASSEILHVD